ncbi:MAG TPA: hypothetical protein VF026_16175 [Ktedonobacteraceae bacterium]
MAINIPADLFSAIPNFTLPDALGQPVTLSQLLTQGPVILTFYAHFQQEKGGRS